MLSEADSFFDAERRGEIIAMQEVSAVSDAMEASKK